MVSPSHPSFVTPRNAEPGQGGTELVRSFNSSAGDDQYSRLTSSNSYEWKVNNVRNSSHIICTCGAIDLIEKEKQTLQQKENDMRQHRAHCIEIEAQLLHLDKEYKAVEKLRQDLEEEKKKYLRLLEKMKKDRSDVVEEKSKVCIQLSEHKEGFKSWESIEKLMKENQEEKLKMKAQYEKMIEDFQRENDNLKRDAEALKKKERDLDLREMKLEELQQKLFEVKKAYDLEKKAFKAEKEQLRLREEEYGERTKQDFFILNSMEELNRANNQKELSTCQMRDELERERREVERLREEAENVRIINETKRLELEDFHKQLKDQMALARKEDVDVNKQLTQIISLQKDLTKCREELEKKNAELIREFDFQRQKLDDTQTTRASPIRPPSSHRDISEEIRLKVLLDEKQNTIDELQRELVQSRAALFHPSAGSHGYPYPSAPVAAPVDYNNMALVHLQNQGAQAVQNVTQEKEVAIEEIRRETEFSKEQIQYLEQKVKNDWNKFEGIVENWHRKHTEEIQEKQDEKSVGDLQTQSMSSEIRRISQVATPYQAIRRSMLEEQRLSQNVPSSSSEQRWSTEQLPLKGMERGNTVQVGTAPSSSSEHQWSTEPLPVEIIDREALLQQALEQQRITLEQEKQQALNEQAAIFAERLEKVRIHNQQEKRDGSTRCSSTLSPEARNRVTAVEKEKNTLLNHTGESQREIARLHGKHMEPTESLQEKLGAEMAQLREDIARARKDAETSEATLQVCREAHSAEVVALKTQAFNVNALQSHKQHVNEGVHQTSKSIATSTEACDDEIMKNKEQVLEDLRFSLTQNHTLQLQMIEAKMEQDRIDHNAQLTDQKKIHEEERVQWKKKYDNLKKIVETHENKKLSYYQLDQTLPIYHYSSHVDSYLPQLKETIDNNNYSNNVNNYPVGSDRLSQLHQELNDIKKQPAEMENKYVPLQSSAKDESTQVQQLQAYLAEEKNRVQKLEKLLGEQRMNRAFDGDEQSPQLTDENQQWSDLSKERNISVQQCTELSKQIQEKEELLQKCAIITEERDALSAQCVELAKRIQENEDRRKIHCSELSAQFEEKEERWKIEMKKLEESDLDRKKGTRKEESIKFLKSIQTKKFNEAMQSNKRKKDELDRRERKIKENEQQLRLLERQQRDHEKRFLDQKKKFEEEKSKSIKEHNNYLQLAEEIKTEKLKVQKLKGDLQEEHHHLSNEMDRAEQFKKEIEDHERKIWEEARQEFSCRIDEIRKQKEDLIIKVREQNNCDLEGIQKENEEQYMKLIEQKDCELEEVRFQLTEEYTKRMKNIEEKVKKDRLEYKEQKKIYEGERSQFENERIQFQNSEMNLQQELQLIRVKESNTSKILQNEIKRVQEYELKLQEQHSTDLIQKNDTLKDTYAEVSQRLEETKKIFQNELQQKEEALQNLVQEHSITKKQEITELHNEWNEKMATLIQQHNTERADLQMKLEQAYNKKKEQEIAQLNAEWNKKMDTAAKQHGTESESHRMTLVEEYRIEKEQALDNLRRNLLKEYDRKKEVELDDLQLKLSEKYTQSLQEINQKMEQDHTEHKALITKQEESWEEERTKWLAEQEENKKHAQKLQLQVTEYEKQIQKSQGEQIRLMLKEEKRNESYDSKLILLTKKENESKRECEIRLQNLKTVAIEVEGQKKILEIRDKKAQAVFDNKNEELDEREKGLDEWSHILDNDQKVCDDLLKDITKEKELLIQKEKELELEEKEKILKDNCVQEKQSLEEQRELLEKEQLVQKEEYKNKEVELIVNVQRQEIALKEKEIELGKKLEEIEAERKKFEETEESIQMRYQYDLANRTKSLHRKEQELDLLKDTEKKKIIQIQESMERKKDELDKREEELNNRAFELSEIKKQYIYLQKQGQINERYEAGVDHRNRKSLVSARSATTRSNAKTDFKF